MRVTIWRSGRATSSSRLLVRVTTRVRGTHMADETIPVEQPDQPAASHGFAALASLPTELLTAQMLAQAGEGVGRLHAALTAAGVRVDAYTEQFVRISEWVNAHPEQVDTVRLMGGDEHDLVTALMAEWLTTHLPTKAQPEAQTVMADGSSTSYDAASKVVSLASRRRARSGKRSRQPATR